MKTITVNTNGLLNSVAVANTFMPREGDFEGKLVLLGNDSKLQVKSSNYIQTVIFKEIPFVSSDLTDDSFNALSVDGKKLLTVLKAAKTDEVQIELHAEHILIKSGRSRVKIETLANTQDISISTGTDSSFDISSHIGSMEQILHATDQNNPKFELNGVLLQAKNGTLSIVGTDTRRLASLVNETSMTDTEIIVPKEAITTIVKLFNGFDVSAHTTDTSLSVHTNTISYETKLINGKYPEWQRIIPGELKQSITISRYTLMTMVKEASIFDSEIIISIVNGEIRIRDFGGSTEVVDEFSSDANANIKFGVNAKAVLDFLNSFDEDNVQIGFNGANLPIMLVANPSYKEVLMPIVMPELEINSDEEIQDAA